MAEYLDEQQRRQEFLAAELLGWTRIGPHKQMWRSGIPAGENRHQPIPRFYSDLNAAWKLFNAIEEEYGPGPIKDRVDFAALRKMSPGAAAKYITDFVYRLLTEN